MRLGDLDALKKYCERIATAKRMGREDDDSGMA